VIDIADALDLLDSCVREHGASYRSPPRHMPAARASGGLDTGQAVTDSIVTLAMTKAGTPITAVRRLTGTSIGVAYASGQNPLNLTLGAVVVLCAAESVERRGDTWAVALQAALRAASRFLDLLPDGVVECAAEATEETSVPPRWRPMYADPAWIGVNRAGRGRSSSRP
jgi:hypothetical protein